MDYQEACRATENQVRYWNVMFFAVFRDKWLAAGGR
jgi:hypothetical protein